MLTEKQVGLISAAFDKAAGSAGAIEVQQVEELAAQLFRATLSDDILDVIIDLTDGADAVSREDFIEIMAAIMERTTQWGSLATAMQGSVAVVLAGACWFPLSRPVRRLVRRHARPRWL